MNRLNSAISQIEQINSLNQRDQWINRIHPLVKLALTIIYIVITVSFDRYDISSLVVMALYLWFVFTFRELSFKDALYRIRLVIPVVCLVGIFNPIFDREPYAIIGGVFISSGAISMITLSIKGLFALLAAYLLIVTTSIDDICYSLRLIHVPKGIVTVILLIYRYLFMLIKEVEKVTIAYKLRAPMQKGIHISAWGSLVGQILLRSMDRAEIIYDAMSLRGYKGEFVSSINKKMGLADLIYLAVWIVVLLAIRNTNIVGLVGELFI